MTFFRSRLDRKSVVIGCAANLAIHGGVKSADGIAVLAVELRCDSLKEAVIPQDMRKLKPVERM